MRRLVTLGLSVVVIAQIAHAQSDRRPCPGVESGADAARQVLCWFDREQNGIEGCGVNSEAANACVRQAATWCANAALDEVPVINACFLAYVRAGQLDDAFSMIRYLQNPTPEVTKCLESLQTVMVKFASTPEGAELRIDDQYYGTTPLEVELRGRWWKTTSRATLKFGEGDNAVEALVSRQDFVNAFNRRACVMSEVLIKRPESSQSTVEQTPHALTTDESARNNENSAGSTEQPQPLPTGASGLVSGRISIPAVVAITAGGVGIITGGVLLAITGARASYLRSLDTNTVWNQDLQKKHDSLKPLSIGGAIALGVGAALAATGIVMLTTAGRSAPEAHTAQSRQTLRFSSQQFQWVGNF